MKKTKHTESKIAAPPLRGVIARTASTDRGMAQGVSRPERRRNQPKADEWSDDDSLLLILGLMIGG